MGQPPLTTMRSPVLKCPFCHRIQQNIKLRVGKPIECFGCGAQLQLSISQGYSSAFVGLCIVVGVCFLLRLSLTWLVIAVILFWFPAFVLWNFIFVRIVPPRLERYVPPPPGLGYKIISLDLAHSASSESGSDSTERQTESGSQARRSE